MLINRKGVKEYALDMAAMHRPGRFTRVSKEFTLAMEGVLKEYIKKHVHSLPSVGKTIK